MDIFFTGSAFEGAFLVWAQVYPKRPPEKRDISGAVVRFLDSRTENVRFLGRDRMSFISIPQNIHAVQYIISHCFITLQAYVGHSRTGGSIRILALAFSACSSCSASSR